MAWLCSLISPNNWEVAAIRTRSYFLVAITVVLLLAVSGVAWAEEATVESVTVSIDSKDAPPPVRMEKRMELSVATVGDQVLVGRKVAEVNNNKNSYEKLVKEVFDRVLVGYSVQKVTITPGPATHIAVFILPWGEVVRQVRLDIDYGGVSPAMAELIKEDMGNIEERIKDVLVGMPVDSADWASGITKTVIREYLADQLPEFKANLELAAGELTVVKLSLMPTGAIIQNTKVTLRSKSIPNVLLLPAYSPIEEAAGKLRGLPVAFVERHSRYFADAILASLAEKPMVRRYGLQLGAQLITGPETELVIDADTDKYKITLEGFLDVGRAVDNTSARFHIGQYVGKKDELFLETTFITSSVSWDFTPGWGHRLGEKTELGMKYQLNDKQVILWMNQNLANRWSLRLERVPAAGRDEVGIRYKLHDFLSAEYVFTNNDRWLRLVANL